MASYLTQGDTSLYRMTIGGVATAIALPTGITLTGSTNPCRAALFGVGNTPVLIVVNGGTHDFFIDVTGTARQLQLSPPTVPALLTAGTGTGLTGVYKVVSTFKVKDANGATVLESGFSPVSVASASLVNTTLRLDNIAVSGSAIVNARGLYRTLAGGSTFYPWFDIDDNTTLADDRGTADSLLSILPATAVRFGAPPDLKLIAVWRDRLWAVPRGQIDNLRWTEERNFYGWAADNEIIAPPLKSDPYGITALIPRRDDIGVGRRKRLYKVVGDSNDTFKRVGVSPDLGPINQESVVVHDNTAYFLTEKGVAEWSDAGCGLISERQVDAWFTSDLYFNRAMFSSAIGRYNPDLDAYELLLANLGSSTLDRWVTYHLKSRTWYGPHKTSAFTLACAANNSEFKGTLSDSNQLPLSVFGGTDGFLYKRDTTNVSDHTTAVDLSVALPFLSAMDPDRDKWFGRPTVHTRAEAQGTLTLTPKVGTLSAAAGTALTHALTLDRRVLPILGVGRYCQLTLTHSATTERPRIYGIEIPWHFVGRR